MPPFTLVSLQPRHAAFRAAGRRRPIAPYIIAQGSALVDRARCASPPARRRHSAARGSTRAEGTRRCAARGCAIGAWRARADRGYDAYAPRACAGQAVSCPERATGNASCVACGARWPVRLRKRCRTPLCAGRPVRPEPEMGSKSSARVRDPIQRLIAEATREAFMIRQSTRFAVGPVRRGRRARSGAGASSARPVDGAGRRRGRTPGFRSRAPARSGCPRTRSAASRRRCRPMSTTAGWPP